MCGKGTGVGPKHIEVPLSAEGPEAGSTALRHGATPPAWKDLHDVNEQHGEQFCEQHRDWRHSTSQNSSPEEMMNGPLGELGGHCNALFSSASFPDVNSEKY